MRSDIEILRALAGGLPAETRPWRAAAMQLGMSEDALVGRLREMRRDGAIKRVGASIDYRKANWCANAMVAWQVAAGEVERAGAAAAGFEAVSHCYEREAAPEWPYNLYTMVHAREAGELNEILLKLEKTIAPQARVVLKTLREFKKTPARF